MHPDGNGRPTAPASPPTMPQRVVLDPELAATLQLAGPLTLKRAWPRQTEHAALEYVDGRGRLAPGQWFAEPAACRAAARAIRREAGAQGTVAVVGDGRLLLQLGGADRKLPGLAPLLARPGATLLVHRPERRAVVRLEETTVTRYAKVVPPGRAAALAAQLTALQTVAGNRLRIPTLHAVDAALGVVTMSALPGKPLYALLDHPALPAYLAAAGQALRTLHATTPPAGTGTHDAAAEVEVLTHWLARAQEVAPAQVPALVSQARPIAAALAAGGSNAVLLHRDFYDKQIIVDGDGSVGLLDFDTLATGEAALDVANALVHLELRAWQRAWPFAGPSRKRPS